MRDFASCFSEHAIKVSDSSCSGSSSGKSSVISTSAGHSASSVQTAITTLYRTQLSTLKDLLIKVTWSKTHVGPAFSLGIDDDPYSHNWNPTSVNSHILRKKKGNQSYVSAHSVVGLYWDYSAAKFSSGPEPVSNYFAVVIVDAEFALLLGDLSREFIKRFEDIIRVGQFSLIGRKEQISAQAVFSTKARFSDEGKDHDIDVRCKGHSWDSNESELVVSVDKKRVVQVRRLQWNFRGNQTIFIDGLPVDMMWDVRDWWFSSPQGYAVFMFRKRSALESRLWFEEEMLLRERGITGFSLLIQAFKNP